jgi:hypothetical protein
MRWKPLLMTAALALIVVSACDEFSSTMIAPAGGEPPIAQDPFSARQP